MSQKHNKLKLMLIGLVSVGAFMIASPVDAVSVTHEQRTDFGMANKRLNPQDPNLPADYVTSGSLKGTTKVQISMTSDTTPEATKPEAALPSQAQGSSVASKGQGKATLPQTSGAEISLPLVVGGLLLSSAFALPIIKKQLIIR